MARLFAQAATRYLAWRERLDRPDASRRSSGPSRVRRWRCARTSLSVTRIETLRRDPYAIYAERILA